MRLWHIKLLPALPNAQLRGQHRECCALRGKGWGTKQSTVAYVSRHPYAYLFHYHRQVMTEITKRGIARITPVWWDPTYRGPQIGFDASPFTASGFTVSGFSVSGETVSGLSISGLTVSGLPVSDYPEHDADYLAECLENLRKKNHVITLWEEL